MKEFKLCYVDQPWAFFTTQEVFNQWGDDWDDRPYEHNAGEPYFYSKDDADSGLEPWEILKVAFDGNWETPSSNTINSKYSVSDINSGAVCWLKSPSWEQNPIIIKAGVTLNEFRQLINISGDNIYEIIKQK